MTTFPWDLLKAENLRSICRDIGWSRTSRRDIMIAFLTAVEEQGLEKALKLELGEPQQKTPKTNPSSAQSSPNNTPLKRSFGPVISDYNTRHRDKRVRISDPGPRSSRKKAVRVARKTATSQLHRPSSNRQPRKLKSALKNNQSPAKAARREVFDGVVLHKWPPSSKGKDKDEISEQDEDAEYDAVDDLLEGDGLPSREESELAGSNKENESIPEGAYVNDDENQLQSNVVHSTESDNYFAQRVPENSREVIEDSADEDIDAEGEHEEMIVSEVAEPEKAVEHGQKVGLETEGIESDAVIVGSDPIRYENYDVSQLGREEINQIEQLLRSAVESGHIV